MSIIIAYVFLYLFALMAEGATAKNKRRLLMLTCLALAFFAGFRDMSWADTGVYQMCFLDYTPKFGVCLLTEQHKYTPNICAYYALAFGAYS